MICEISDVKIYFVEQERTRLCLGDFPCPLIEGLGVDDQRDCFPGVCPYWSGWGHWSFCEATCGASFRSRTRQCLGDHPPGVGCPLFGEPLEVDTCSLGECPYWGKWGGWMSCSSSCGDGVRSRSRECIGDFPLQYCAPGSRKEEEVGYFELGFVAHEVPLLRHSTLLSYFVGL